MLGTVKLDNTLPLSDQRNVNQITAQSRNPTVVTVVRDTCATIMPPARAKKTSFVIINVSQDVIKLDDQLQRTSWVVSQLGCCHQ